MFGCKVCAMLQSAGFQRDATSEYQVCRNSPYYVFLVGDRSYYHKLGSLRGLPLSMCAALSNINPGTPICPKKLQPIRYSTT
jgi:hypothetical protein